jgi:hypothetical protein
MGQTLSGWQRWLRLRQQGLEDLSGLLVRSVPSGPPVLLGLGDHQRRVRLEGLLGPSRQLILRVPLRLPVLLGLGDHLRRVCRVRLMGQLSPSRQSVLRVRLRPPVLEAPLVPAAQVPPEVLEVPR